MSYVAHGGFDASAQKSDTVLLTLPAQGLYCGGAGIVKVKTADGSVLSFTVVAGAILPWEIVQIFSTGTTATLLIGARK
jgi:hypothetical protein